jgi:ferrous iron transport protein B
VGSKRFKLVDLPGTYSLLSGSPDEEVARNFLLFARPDVTVIVVDATRLERNLNLTLQVLQITGRAVVCVNLMDEAKAHGIDIDIPGLAADLGVPVVPASARRGEGIEGLTAAIRDVAEGRFVSRPKHVDHPSPAVRKAIDHIASRLRAEHPELPSAEWIAQRLLEGDTRIRQAVETGELAILKDELIELEVIT